VTPRLIVRLAPALVLSALAFAASAGPKDAAATGKIDEAINVHYLATDFNKAEAQLLGVIKACGKDCGPSVIGRAWMYVGLVRGSGKQDLAGARDAFNKARDADPGMQLDSALATPEVQAEYDAVFSGKSATPVATASGSEPAAAGSAPVAEGEPECNVDPGSEIEVRRPIPLSCSVPAGTTRAILAYKEFGGTQFNNVPMKLDEGNAKVAIPCSATKMIGNIAYVIVFKDASGATIGSVGSLEEPASLSIVQSTIQAPPAFPGDAPPARCAEEVECPPGLPGCTPAGGGGWGDTCTPAEPCKKGLYCASGTCENAPTCDTDSECDSGHCSDGFCEMDSGDGKGGKGGYKRFWLGLHVAPDIIFFKSDRDVCSLESVGNNRYGCYEADGRPLVNSTPAGNTTEDAFPYLVDGKGRVNGGPYLATVRALISAEYAITSNFLAGARVGMAFNGGPNAYNYSGRGQVNSSVVEVQKGKAFFPVHLEARLTYHIVSLAKPGFHPYIHVGGGMAQVDAKMTLPVCRNNYLSEGSPCRATPTSPLDTRDVTVWKRVGRNFVTAGGGIMYPFGNFGAVLNVNFMYMLPDSGIVLEPSLGAVMGF
jgi:hypothetical protein